MYQYYVSSEVLTVAALVFLFLILLIPIIGAGVAIVLFALLLLYPSAFRIFSPTLLLFYIGFVVILIACALLYFILGMRDKPLLYIQVVCYIFPLILLLAMMWDKYIKTPSVADMLSVLFIVLLIILIIIIFAIPVLGVIASITMFVSLLISGESIVTPNNIPFLTYGLIIFVICALIYIILTLRLKTNILALVLKVITHLIDNEYRKTSKEIKKSLVTEIAKTNLEVAYADFKICDNSEKLNKHYSIKNIYTIKT